MRQKLLLLSAVFFGILAFVLTFHQIKLEKEKALGAARNVVLIRVTRDLSADDVLKESDLVPQRTKRFITNLSKDIPWSKKKSIVGRKLSMFVQKGAFLSWYDLEQASRGSSGLRSLVRTGYRAISISVDATSSVTGLIQPGDNVDIIGTFRFPGMKGDKSFDTLTLTILQRVNVLATGTNTGRMPSSITGAPVRARGYGTVTLELSPKEVEMIVFASQKGRLTLSLRNFEESQIEDKLQSVNFKYLEGNLDKYNQERKEKMKRRTKKYYNSGN